LPARYGSIRLGDTQAGVDAADVWRDAVAKG